MDRPPAIAVSDDDFEEYEEFLAWKKKHGLRATIRKMARKQGVDEERDEVEHRKTARDVSRLNKAIAKQEETARDIARLKGSLEATMKGKHLNKIDEQEPDESRVREMNERVDGEQGGKTLAKAAGKKKK